MIKGKLDLPKITAGLEKYARQVGETGKDATARWAVQLCRELARQTQAWGTDRVKSYERQVNAIYADFLKVVIVMPNARPLNKRYLASSFDLIAWVKENRIKGIRTKKLPYEGKKLCSQSTLNRAVEYETKKIGTAKGGWIGAGEFLAAEQTGLDRINIGRGYIPWAGKNSHLGRGSMDKKPHHPVAIMDNQARYVGLDDILSRASSARAIEMAGKVTLKRYEKIIERLAK